jgi:hypothetical protein
VPILLIQYLTLRDVTGLVLGVLGIELLILGVLGVVCSLRSAVRASHELDHSLAPAPGAPRARSPRSSALRVQRAQSV